MEIEPVANGKSKEKSKESAKSDPILNAYRELGFKERFRTRAQKLTERYSDKEPSPVKSNALENSNSLSQEPKRSKRLENGITNGKMCDEFRIDNIELKMFSKKLTDFWNKVFLRKKKEVSKTEGKELSRQLSSEKSTDHAHALTQWGCVVPSEEDQKAFVENIKNNIEDLYRIYKYFQDKGGYYEVFAKLRPLRVKQRLATQYQVTNEEFLVDVFGTYKRILFHFERFTEDASYSKKGSALKEVLEIDPELLTTPKIFSEPPKAGEEEKFIQEVLDQQSALLAGFESIYGLREEFFKLDHIYKHHGDQHVDIVHQNPEIFGFEVYKKKLHQRKEVIPLKDYITYQYLVAHNPDPNLRTPEGNVKYAVNIDIDGWSEVLEELNKLPPEFMCLSNKDALSHLKRKVLGINLPQIYLKVEGAWTGGHEENLRMRAININHGPKGSHWYTIDHKDVPRLREVVKKEYKIDIHKCEGLWFADLDFLLRHKLEVQYFIQHKGDIVLLGPGCLHWVRAKGIAINSAWNFGTACKKQFEVAFERFQINREINSDVKTVIPLHNLVLELLRKKEPSYNDETRE